MKNEIYLDGNATTELSPGALRAATRALADIYGNPSSTHSAGLRARAILQDTRERARRVLGAGDGHLIFNSGATEGIQTAVLSALCGIRERMDKGEHAGKLLLYGATEHKAVPESLAHWNRVLGLNLELRKLPVDANGRHDLDVLWCLAPNAALVCTMAANNETGAISDLDGIAAALEGSPALWLVDCVQALGKLPLQLSGSRIDYAPFSGHKLYAPKGVGMLYVRAGAPYTPLMTGGGQEEGLRAGTENMSGIAALGAVLAELEEGNVFRSHAELEAMRGRLVDSLRRAFPDIVFNTPLDISIPTTLNVTVPGLRSGVLLDAFDAAGVRISAGSACSAAKSLPSYVLEAMGLPDWRSSNAVRISFGAAASHAVIDEACRRIERCGVTLRNSGLLGGTGTDPIDGVVELSAGDCHAWLVLDAAAGSAAVIDLQPTLASAAEELLERARCKLDAVLSTTDPSSWKAQGDELMIGRRRIRRIGVEHGNVYLLDGGPGKPGMAFIGGASSGQLGDLVGPETLLCRSKSGEVPACTSMHAFSKGWPAGSGDVELNAGSLLALVRQQPDAIVVDVRENFEHAASRLPEEFPENINVPLGCLVNAIPAWLASGHRPPLVFFCRSGNRSARAASCLRALGYERAFHLGGGLAQAEAVFETAARSAGAQA